MMDIESVGDSVNPPSNVPKVRQDTKHGSEVGQAHRQGGSAQSSIEASKQAFNKAVLASSLEVTLSAGNQSLSLLFKTAIEQLNQVLEPELGKDAIQKAADSGVDYGPQATADRIVSLSTAFFGKYQANHPEKDLTTALNDFTKLIGGGIDKGFAEARSILDGLKVLQGDIASNIDKTYELVQTGLKAFVDNYPRTGEGKAPDKSSA